MPAAQSFIQILGTFLAPLFIFIASFLFFIGNRTRVKAVKNKLAPPFKEAEFDIMYGQGISKAGDVLDMATALNIVDKSGAWYSYSGERMGQGRENVKAFLKEHPDICSEIEKKVRDMYGLKISDNGDEETTEE